MRNAEDIAHLCQDARPQGNGWQARCPAHDDQQASLSIHDGARGVLLHCHAGCEYPAIVDALGLQRGDLSRNGVVAHSNGNGPRRRIVATYDYLDAEGTLLYQSVRYEPKTFRQRRPHPDYDGDWLWSMRGMAMVLYRLPDVLQASQVFVVEGEKDADNLAALGLVATTNAQGAGKWHKSYSESLRGKDVVILPDNDEPGKKHARLVAKSLRGIATSVRIVGLPVPHKGDVSDWLEGGHTAEELEALVGATEPETEGNKKRQSKPLSQQAMLNKSYQGAEPAILSADPEAWRAGLLLKADGNPTENISNVMLLLEHLPESAVLWWDDFAYRPMVDARPFDDDDIIVFAGLLTRHFGVPLVRYEMLRRCLYATARLRKRDPLQDYVHGLRWDGNARLTHWLAQYAGADHTTLNSWIGTTLCCALVARALTPGCQQRYVVILEGPENAGKSKLCAALGAPWYGAITTGFDAKETMLALRGCWLMEVEELNQMRRSEEAAVKAFVTRREDRIILKYKNEPTTYQRRTVLVGTVNPQADGYLRGLTADDDTRYLPVRVATINVEGVEAIRDQLYAEAKTLIEQGMSWWEMPAGEGIETALNESRGERREHLIYEGTLREWLANGHRKAHEHTTMEEIMAQALGIEERERWSNRMLQLQVGAALRACGWERVTKRVQGVPRKVWVTANFVQDVF